jgi:hypothetical protein
MKTKVNTSNLKKGIVTICSALLISTGSFTQPNPDVFKNGEMASVVRLEVLMNGTEQSIRYVAPAVNENEEFTPALERLNAMAELAEASLKYVAPEAEEITAELDRLDRLADSIESRLAFKAPAVNDSHEFDNIPDNSNEIMLAERTK